MKLMRRHRSKYALLAITLSVLSTGPGRVAGASQPPGRYSFEHFAYSSNNGSPPDVGAIAQDKNGDLWLASQTGLFIFDGLHFQRFHPTGSQDLRSDLTYSMFLDSKQRLWFGYYSGGASVIINGRVANFDAGLPKGPLKTFAEDRDGRIWAMSVKGLSYFQDNHWQLFSGGLKPEFGIPYVMLAARDGTLWLATNSTLLFLRPGAHAFERSNVAVKEPWAMEQGPDGRLWLSDEGHGTRPILPAGAGSVSTGSDTFPDLVARRLLFDRWGNLWLVLQRQPGIARIANPERVATGRAVAKEDISASYDASNGLSADRADTVIEDRQGVIWAGTRFGVDRFLPVNFSMRPDIVTTPRTGYRFVQSPDGRIAIANDDTISLYPDEKAPAHIIKASGAVRSLRADRNGSLLAAGDFGLARIVGESLQNIALPPHLKSSMLFDCQVARDGSIWVLTRQDGVFVLRAGRWSQVLPQAMVGAASPRVMLLDGRDRLWVGLDNNAVGLYSDGTFRRFGAEAGFKTGFPQSALAVGDKILVGGELGLAGFDGEHFHTILSQDHPHMSLISGLAQDRSGNLWVSGSRGISELKPEQWETLIKAGRPDLHVDLMAPVGETLFFSQLNCCENTILRTAQGNLWFLTMRGIALIDQTRRPALFAQPRPIFRSVASNGEERAISDPLTLSAGSPDINIEYTSDSIANAQQIQFRYRLVGGSDHRWIDAGSRRQASYTSLAKGDYRFELEVKQGNGEWSGQIATLHFIVPPTFAQTLLAKVLAALVAGGAIVLIYRIRLRYAMDALRKRLDDRTRERERIARDLHDTLLQSVQALILRIDNARQDIPVESPAYGELDTSLEQAENVVEQTRRTLQGLRLSDNGIGLDQLLGRLIQTVRFPSEVALSFDAVGDFSRLNRDVQQEVAFIAHEALSNVARHAEAKAVSIQVQLDRKGLQLLVTDNGRGIPGDVLVHGGRERHFGLVGMRERAERLKASLEISSEDGVGTRVLLKVPAKFCVN
ncbi:sensor histidine kinase [Novosphingobium terrae]|uniref:sensor histidine kinase n=1 Tax=Novosphingobium terrae TaxID=2726189 RepID=UPI001981FFBC|nr:sensor histidine kinase [Novosphingobium terrae]